ncbi:MAG: TRAP transporter substrate-binding protein [Candidatus Eremiobacteraeota bacterium]|nr:TRAP transporter substrate-binding protein [Candidatus Eremiobacteraeota bacterium]MBV8353864.1 TRAP transporter substrate-binding protein [Candidatus Eremiobacteraeota bacterium]
MKRKTFAAGLASIAIVPRPAGAAQFKWKYGSDLSADHPISVRAVQAFGRIRKETGGAVDIASYPNSVLGSDPQMLTQLRSGALEMLAYAGGILDVVVPLASIENVAFAFHRREAAFAAMDGDLGALIRAQIVEKGMIPLERVWENGFREFTTSTHPIRTVDDLAGLKIRVSPGKLRFDTFRSLGASPTPIAPNEVYTAMQTHIVDGQETALLYMATQRYYEVQKYCSLTNHIWSGYWNLINADKWNALPPNYQRIVRTALNDAVPLQRADNAVQNRSIEDKLRRLGMIFNTTTPTSFKAKLVASGYYGRWREEFGEKAWAALEKYSGKLS